MGIVNPHIFSVGSCQINDRIDTVNIEEKSSQKIKYLFVLVDLKKNIFQSHKAFPHRVFLHFHPMLLLIVFQKRNGYCKPPDARDSKRDHGGRDTRYTQLLSEKDKKQAGGERNTASDISPRIPV